MSFFRSIPVILVMLLPSALTFATIGDDSYIAGYAAGMLKQNLQLDMPSLEVSEGIITLPTDGLGDETKTKAIELLSAIPGVQQVKTSDNSSQATETALNPNQNPPTAVNLTAASASSMIKGFLPPGHLFKPLLADPRWAHFSASYRNYQTNNFDGRNIASVSFGETIPFYRSSFGQSNVLWEAGIQAGVFSDFALDKPSSDLINSDFIVSAYASMRVGEFSAFGRIYHQSSHLGDEFLLTTKLQRINLSYEGMDLRLSYELPYGVRVYGGGGGLIDREPSSLKIWSTQAGLEFRSPWRIDFAVMRPIIAVDIKNFEENNWNTDVSARAGVEFENLQVLGRKLQILGEYYNGFTPSGQFYKDKVEYYGVGAHYHF